MSNSSTSQERFLKMGATRSSCEAFIQILKPLYFNYDKANKKYISIKKLMNHWNTKKFLGEEVVLEKIDYNKEWETRFDWITKEDWVSNFEKYIQYAEESVQKLSNKIEELNELINENYKREYEYILSNLVRIYEKTLSSKAFIEEKYQDFISLQHSYVSEGQNNQFIFDLGIEILTKSDPLNFQEDNLKETLIQEAKKHIS